uniref:Uncharacterized protein n=1 Tax=Arundo donax TaxID=35708 RepID=A0A0A8ZQC0_ARUDO
MLQCMQFSREIVVKFHHSLLLSKYACI